MPVCGRLCIFCPALRPRSKQAVKRYKKLIADIFHTPRHQVCSNQPLFDDEIVTSCAICDNLWLLALTFYVKVLLFSRV